MEHAQTNMDHVSLCDSRSGKQTWSTCERAELRGVLGATQDRIKSLQATIADDSRLQHLVDRGTPWRSADPTKEIDESSVKMLKLQTELVETLRDNELLRQAIRSTPALPDPQLGHRTVSSTQLASSARSSLSVQQRREVADMVRRQENLKKTQMESYETQIQALQRGRDQAERKLAEAEQR